MAEDFERRMSAKRKLREGEKEKARRKLSLMSDVKTTRL